MGLNSSLPSFELVHGDVIANNCSLNIVSSQRQFGCHPGSPYGMRIAQAYVIESMFGLKKWREMNGLLASWGLIG